MGSAWCLIQILYFAASWNFPKFIYHFVNTVKKKMKTETKQITKTYLDKQQRRCKVHITYFEQEIPREKWLARQWRLSSCTLVTAIFEMICLMLYDKLSIYIHVNTAWVNNNEVFIWTGYLEFRKLLNWSLIASYPFKCLKSILTHFTPMSLF